MDKATALSQHTEKRPRVVRSCHHPGSGSASASHVHDHLATRKPLAHHPHLHTGDLGPWGGVQLLECTEGALLSEPLESPAVPASPGVPAPAGSGSVRALLVPLRFPPSLLLPALSQNSTRPGPARGSLQAFALATPLPAGPLSARLGNNTSNKKS